MIAKINNIYRIIPYRNSKKVVLISLHKIGDTVFSFPTIRFFYEKYAEDLTIMCLESTKPLYDLLNIKLNITPMDYNDFYFGGRIAGFKLRKLLRTLRPRIIIDITGEINSVSLFYLNSRAEMIYGRCSMYLKPFYDKYVFKEERPTLLDRIFDVVRFFNSEAKIGDYQIKQQIKHSVNKICIHPFAGWEAKEWNLNKFIKVAEHLSKIYTCKFISEPNRIPIDVIYQIKEIHAELTITHSLDELIAQIRDCDLFIGNDSGPVNIASYLGKKTFIIFGPVNPLYCLDGDTNVQFIVKKLRCSPIGAEHYCFTNAGREGCPTFECMNQLSVQDVLKAITSLINK
ncbi:MAG: glycosyltransferase family 9 protein [Sphingobacteriaceae bacterium]|nr:glycosyltransferase family 9 protein [Sphingobacteriaceae bacterium]